ncbi:hypothetical protein GC173_01880 [bacterium]|nr:hypothetical protein [bacterium]
MALLLCAVSPLPASGDDRASTYTLSALLSRLAAIEADMASCAAIVEKRGPDGTVDRCLTVKMGSLEYAEMLSAFPDKDFSGDDRTIWSFDGNGTWTWGNGMNGGWLRPKNQVTEFQFGLSLAGLTYRSTAAVEFPLSEWCDPGQTDPPMSREELVETFKRLGITDRDERLRRAFRQRTVSYSSVGTAETITISLKGQPVFDDVYRYESGALKSVTSLADGVKVNMIEVSGWTSYKGHRIPAKATSTQVLGTQGEILKWDYALLHIEALPADFPKTFFNLRDVYPDGAVIMAEGSDDLTPAIVGDRRALDVSTANLMPSAFDRFGPLSLAETRRQMGLKAE